MFSIFEKKEFLKDHLEGITDIHNHILPGIDDGAANVEEAVQLLMKYKELGIKQFIATPHVMNDYYPNTQKTIGEALKLLRSRIFENPSLAEIQITAAAEYMMDQHFMELMEKEKLLTMKDNYVLVEMSYFQPPINLNEILFTLQTNGYRAVLAHPERYAYFHGRDLKKYEDLKKRGCMFQINALSLTTHYGIHMEKTAEKLLEAGMIDFIGTDTHRLQHLEKLSAIKFRKKLKDPLMAVISNTKKIFN